MSTEVASRKLNLEPYDSRRLANLCGRLDENIQHISRRLGIDIFNRGNEFTFSGDASAVDAASNVISLLYDQAGEGLDITPEMVHLQLQGTGIAEDNTVEFPADDMVVRTKRTRIRPRGDHQRDYVRSIRRHDINFGIGPAGTGKTWLAVACAVESLERGEVQRIMLVRPAVEAGEKLGFLPGDLAEKIDPYLRPLYDALYEMLGFEQVAKYMERSVIEVAPLAYMRGRTLNNSFIILDEGQNTTMEQMKMFLTRMGFGSKAVLTGDMTQVDLPRHQRSGLVHALDVLDGEKDIGVTRFDSRDVVRHPLVQRIVEAYERYELDNNPDDPAGKQTGKQVPGKHAPGK
ncbi:PhoH family protein [Alcanivorax sp. JB21]|uniref:PhoH family protein n=1 Tax=Alcanivorax limicola TaxID=2874102 RepID=UPI001CBF126C|nr:PhoH family protein [Alcanivorax limicola]MBZ2188641.1 PhoH family protein [Alcanivorax limicola]